jgi:hypothetical protein
VSSGSINASGATNTDAARHSKIVTAEDATVVHLFADRALVLADGLLTWGGPQCARRPRNASAARFGASRLSPSIFALAHGFNASRIASLAWRSAARVPGRSCIAFSRTKSWIMPL